MSLFDKNIFNPFGTGGGIIPKSPIIKIIEKTAEIVVENIASNNITSNESPRYGDIIGVNRMGCTYKHFGVYLNDYSVIHYASRSGDFGKDICIHETTLIKFLDGANNYFVCKFPEAYGRPSKINIKSAIGGSIYTPKWNELFEFLKKKDYRLYSPEETVQRARGRLGESNYNLVTNNCEHFAIWCKTGISESHQVNDVIDILAVSPVCI